MVQIAYFWFENRSERDQIDTARASYTGHSDYRSISVKYLFTALLVQKGGGVDRTTSVALISFFVNFP